MSTLGTRWIHGQHSPCCADHANGRRDAGCCGTRCRGENDAGPIACRPPRALHGHRRGRRIGVRTAGTALGKRTGYMSEGFTLYGSLSVAENLAFFAELYGVTGAERGRRTTDLLRFSRLDSVLNRRAHQVSGGSCDTSRDARRLRQQPLSAPPLKSAHGVRRLLIQPHSSRSGGAQVVSPAERRRWLPSRS
jgi:hypothetical protein